MIYNIRPNGKFKRDEEVPFKSKEDFLKAVYETQSKYRGYDKANEWKKILKQNYKAYYNEDLNF